SAGVRALRRSGRLRGRGGTGPSAWESRSWDIRGPRRRGTSRPRDVAGENITRNRERLGAGLGHRQPPGVVAVVYVHHAAGEGWGERTEEEGRGAPDMGGLDGRGKRRVGAGVADHGLDEADRRRGAGGPGARGEGIHPYSPPAPRLERQR